MAGINDYSETAASNTTLNGIGVSDSSAPNTVDNMVRQIMADVRRAFNDIGGAAVSSGTNTVTLTSGTDFSGGYADGDSLIFIAGGSNTGAVTLNVDSGGAKAVVKGDGSATALTTGDIIAGMPAHVVYDASVGSGSWLLLNPISGLASYLANVSEDTTPQLGGDLDVNGNDITSPDGTDLIDIVDGTITIQTASSTRADITDSGVQLGGSGARVTTVLDEDDLATDSATALATQQSIKAYVDAVPLQLIAESQPTSDVSEVRFTGLAGYQLIVAFYALQLTAASGVSLMGATASGTDRQIASGGLTAGAGDVSMGMVLISNFGIAATHKIAVAVGGEDGDSMDASDATARTDSSDIEAGYCSFQEIWDEFAIIPQSANIEGSTANNRGRVTVYGVPK